MKESVGLWTYESWSAVTGVQTRRDILSAVSPQLQLKYQDSEVTVTKGVESG